MKKRFMFRWGLLCMAALSVFLLLFGSIIPKIQKQQNTVKAYAAEDGISDFVSRMYRVILEREPDETGLAEWTGYLQDGTFTGAEVAEGFIMSEEFLGKDMENGEFVQIMYQAFFGREADPTGLATWVGMLDDGYRKSYIFTGFANSTEFGALCESYGIDASKVEVTVSEQQPNLSEEEYNIWMFVERLYTEVLERTPDMNGIRDWVTLLQNGTWTGAEVASGFIMSEEFQAKDMSNEEYVQIMYRAFFGREADPEGLGTWVTALETEYTKAFVFAGFANSVEFGVLCESYGIVQGEVKVPEIEPDKPYVDYSVITSNDGTEYGRAEGEVIITEQDGLYGAIDYDGTTILQNTYSRLIAQPNNEGYFSLGDEEYVYVFDKNGNEVYRIKSVVDDEEKFLDSLYINEGVITYTFDSIWRELYYNAYDLESGQMIELEKHSGLYDESGFTATRDGLFYFSKDSYLYSADKNGKVTLVYANPFCTGLPGGAVYYPTAPNGDYGLIFYENDVDWKLRIGLLQKDGSEICLIPVFSLNEYFGEEADNVTSYYVRNYYSDGMAVSNHEKKFVIGLKNEDGSIYGEFLLDLSKAEYKSVEMSEPRPNGDKYIYGYEQQVSNLEDVVIAGYEYIALSDEGIYYVQDSGRSFYIDEAGNVLAEYDDCSAFYNGYAAVKKNGYAYLVDTEFNRVSELFEAEVVYNRGSAFEIQNGEQITVLVIE